MKKKFSSALSITLAGLLAVGGVGASPMTSYAAPAGENSVITFAKASGITNTLRTPYSNATGVTLKTSVTDADTQLDVTGSLPTEANDSNSAFTTSPLSNTTGKMIVWTNSVNGKDIGAGTALNTIEVDSNGKATLTADVVNSAITLSYEANGGTYASGATVNPTTKTYLNDLGSKLTDLGKVGYDFKGWSVYTDSTDPSPTTAEIKDSANETDAASTSAIIDGAFKAAKYNKSVKLGAVFDAKKYAVEFNMTNVDGAPADETFNKTYKTVRANNAKVSDVTRKYWEFGGWSAYVKGGADTTPATAEIAAGLSAEDQSEALDAVYENLNYPAAGIEAEPIWISRDFTITYDGNGFESGSLATTTVTKTSSQMNSSATLATVPSLTRKGYAVNATNGWALNNDDGTAGNNTYAATNTFEDVFNPIPYDASNSSSGTPEENDNYKRGTATLYYNWAATKHDVVIHVDISTNEKLTISSGKWGVTDETNSGGTVIGKKATLKSQAAEGADVELPTFVNTAGEVVDTGNYFHVAKVDSRGVELSGYELLGWDTKSPATEAVYTLTDSSFKMGTSSVDLYPFYKNSNTVKVEFDANGGEGTMEDMTGIKPGTDVTLTENTFSKEGYKFKEWASAKNGSGTTYPDGGKVSSIGTDIKIYAQWTPITYTARFNNGASFKETVSATYGTPFSAPSVTPDTGMTLLGWDTDKTVTSNPKYLAGDQLNNLTTTDGATVDLYAIFGETANLATLTYKTHASYAGPTTGGASKDIKITKNVEAPVLDTEAAGVGFVANTGFTFVGWTEEAFENKAEADSKGATIYKVGDKFKATANDELFALYDPKTITVKFDGNADEEKGQIVNGTMADVSVTFNASSSKYVISQIEENAFQSPGYTFVKWTASREDAAQTYTKDAADKEKKVDITTVAGNEDEVIFAAQWRANKYLVKYEANSDTVNGTMTGTNFTSGQTTKLTRFTLENTNKDVEFVGWALSADASEAAFTDEAPVQDVITTANPEKDGQTVTLYAVWGESASKQVADAEAAKAEADQKADAAAKDAATKADEAAKAKDEAAKATDAASKATAAQKTAEGERDAAKADAANQKAAADAANKNVATLTAKQKLANALTTNAGKTKKVSGTSFLTDADAGKSVAIKSGKNVKTLKVTATVKIAGNIYKVRSINAKAFTGKKIRTISIVGTNLKNVDVNAFKGTKATKITVTKANATAKKQLKAAAKAAGLKYAAKGKTVTITKK